MLVTGTHWPQVMRGNTYKQQIKRPLTSLNLPQGVNVWETLKQDGRGSFVMSVLLLISSYSNDHITFLLYILNLNSAVIMKHKIIKFDLSKELGDKIRRMTKPPYRCILNKACLSMSPLLHVVMDQTWLFVPSSIKQDKEDGTCFFLFS